MKLTVFSCREDEIGLFRQSADSMGVELVTTSEAPTLANASLAKDCQAVIVVNTEIGGELIEVWHGLGVEAISIRTVGYERIDYRRATELGIAVSNVGYSPNTVAEYTVMLILMTVRKMKTIMTRSIGQDYSLSDVRGRELSRMTVGVIGTGRIGETVIRNLGGFGCRILAYDLKENGSVRDCAQYVPLETIWNECDLITLHAPATDETHHLINGAIISRMRDGVVIVNTARGSLIETRALIHALEIGKVGAAALDVMEHETGIYHGDFKYQPVKHHELAILNAMPNVLMTPHTAFFTDEAVRDMIELSLKSCIDTVNGGENPWRIN